MFEAYPRFRFLTALCGATLLFSTMSFTFAQDGISRVPNVPLEDLPDLSTVGSNSSYQSGSYLGPASLKVGTEGLTVDLSSAGLNLDGVPVVWGDIAQVSPEESSKESSQGYFKESLRSLPRSLRRSLLRGLSRSP